MITAQEGGVERRLARIVSTVHLEPAYQDRLSRMFPHCSILHPQRLAAVTAEEMAQTEVLVTYGYDVTPETVKAMTSLRWIHVMQSGINKLPFDELMARGIQVTNASGINAVTIAEYLMGMMLNLVRRTFAFYEAQRQRVWDDRTQLDELYGKTVGIVGLGHIGKELAKRANAFGMKVLAMKRNTDVPVDNVDELFGPGELLTLLGRSDYVVLLLPLTPDTENLIGEAELSAMKPAAYLLNACRGEVIDDEALQRSLREGGIAGAVLDVFRTEPLPADSPYWAMDNVWVTPHIAGDHYPEYMPRAFKTLTDNLNLYPARLNEMMNIVDLAHRY